MLIPLRVREGIKWMAISILVLFLTGRILENKVRTLETLLIDDDDDDDVVCNNFWLII